MPAQDWAAAQLAECGPSMHDSQHLLGRYHICDPSSQEEEKERLEDQD